MGSALSEFKKVKEQLINNLAKAIEVTIIKMGDDVKGVAWFSVNAENYNGEYTHDEQAKVWVK